MVQKALGLNFSLGQLATGKHSLSIQQLMDTCVHWYMTSIHGSTNLKEMYKKFVKLWVCFLRFILNLRLMASICKIKKLKVFVK